METSLSTLVHNKAFRNPGDLPWNELPKNYCYFSDLTNDKSLSTLVYEAGGNIDVYVDRGRARSGNTMTSKDSSELYNSKTWQQHDDAFLLQIKEESLQIENPFGYLDLTRWSMIVTDDTLLKISQVSKEYKVTNEKIKEQGYCHY